MSNTKRPPKWIDAIPAELDLDGDPLQLAAELGPRVLSVAICQVVAAVGIPPVRRAAVLAQLVSVLGASVDKRRLLEAERVIKGHSRRLEERDPGPQLVPATPRDGTNSPVSRRGRRKPRALA